MNLLRCTGYVNMLSKATTHRVANTVGASHCSAYFRGKPA